MPRLWALFIMGGCQGLLGWYMVKSGLVDRPDVSQYRLTAHLGLAVLIYAYMLWVIFDLLFPRGAAVGAVAAMGKWALGLVALVYLMILSGGLVAGTDAGFAYNTWPLMGTTFIPPGLYGYDPAWLSAFEDITTIQFNHRIFAYLLTAIIVVFAWRVLHNAGAGRVRWAALFLLLALALQLVLGISTLLMHVPVSLGAAHQGGAVLLLSAAIFLAHSLRAN